MGITAERLRRAYIVYALAIGGASAVVGAIVIASELAERLARDLRALSNPCISTATLICTPGFDGPPPIGLRNYLYPLIMTGLPFVLGVLAIRRRWEFLRVACWFLIAFIVVIFIHGMQSGSVGYVFYSPAALMTGAILGIPLWGVGLARMLHDGGNRQCGRYGAAVVSSLSLAAATAYLLQAFLSWNYSPYLPALPLFVPPLLAGAILLVSLTLFWRGLERVLAAGLAFSAGFVFENFLSAIDITVGFNATTETRFLLGQSLDVIAFLASTAALVIYYRRTPRPVAPISPLAAIP
jgi:hypothetical protein